MVIIDLYLNPKSKFKSISKSDLNPELNLNLIKMKL